MPWGFVGKANAAVGKFVRRRCSALPGSLASEVLETGQGKLISTRAFPFNYEEKLLWHVQPVYIIASSLRVKTPNMDHIRIDDDNVSETSEA